MVKVKVKETKEVAPKVLDKKKNERKVLQVISKRNGTPDSKLSLKAKKKRNRRKKNKTTANGTDMSKEQQESAGKMEGDEAKSSDTSVTAKTTTEIKTPEANTQGKKKKNKKNKKASATDGSSGTTNEEEKMTTDNQESTGNSGEAKETNTQGKKKKNKKNKNAAANNTSSTVTEGEKMTTESQETTDESGKVQEPPTQGKKKRNRKNKRKAEALEDTKSATESTEDKEGDKEDEKPAKRMKVEKKDGDAEGDKPKGKKGKQEKKYVLFIGNLPFDITEEEIREHFKVVGDSFVRVTLMTRQKGNTNKGKGYGFIEVKDVTAYNKAVKLNMSQLKDRKINVEFTTPGKNTKKRRYLIKSKTKKLLGQKKIGKGKKKGSRKH